MLMPKKLILDVDDETWKEVQKYKIDHNFENNNQAVVELIKKGLKNNNGTKPNKSGKP